MSSSTVKKVVVVVLAVLLIILLLAVCGGGDQPANAAASTTEPAKGTKLHITLQPVTVSRTTRKCWSWKFGPYENRDGTSHLRFAWGEDVIACTNARETKWVALPTFDPYHYLGYWEHDHTNKSHSSLGYSWLTINTNWKFSYKALWVPLISKERTLRCTFSASNHTGNCTIYY